MGKRISVIMLSVLLVVMFAYSVTATVANAELSDELDLMQSKCNKLSERCEELRDENQLLKDGLYSETLVLDAAIALIHPDAKGKKVDNVYIAVAPLEAMDNVNATQIAYALKTYDEIEYMLITFIGDNVASYTIRIDK